MRLEVDWDVCVGHGQCYLRAPQLFEPNPDDDWGKPDVLVPDVDPADEAQVAAARKSLQLCPEFAITLDGVSGR
ncbi:ferredoxin [Sporichthya sp.]|uniref:ferredoxin n=1 Tax=Sporichthya sp. TaxID=65475 RepID=UPI0017F6B06B|nr:ferredoxin [Sporichthya sp.]MBA3743571.1 ferredoxin [Sporichthya sp.]